MTDIKTLKDYTTEELHRELLGRLKCQFNQPGCTKTAEDWIIKPFNYQKDPACLPCKWKILEVAKEAIAKRKPKQ